MKFWAIFLFVFGMGFPVFGVPESSPHPFDSTTASPSLDSLYSLYQPYLVNISSYEPIYFLLGADPKDSAYQISFKYRFVGEQGKLAQEHPALKGFHLAYTQTSFWDLKSDSQPFEDTSYKPELMYISPNLAAPLSWLDGLVIQTGLQHESNGRADPYSRSTNFMYVKPVFIHYNPDNKWGFMIAPKIWAYAANDNQTNPDLYAYRGYFDLELKAGKADGLVLGSHFRWAKAGGSIQVDATYPLDQLFQRNLDLYLHVQYVDAWAESLLHYHERNQAVRIGIAIVR